MTAGACVSRGSTKLIRRYDCRPCDTIRDARHRLRGCRHQSAHRGCYDRVLESLYLLDRVPAWSENRLTALVKRPKRYLADPALAMAAAGVNAQSILLDGDLLGRVLDTFVAAQLCPELGCGCPEVASITSGPRKVAKKSISSPISAADG